ncbi:MAG: protein translocase subunit SecD [Lachnospiraceae bacterium]|nr:protein translocase subunit SecD [Lachnospiraceae bacterium]
MKKRTGAIVIILSIVLTVLMGFTAIVGWGKTGTGSMKNIKTGLDLSGGVSITYEAGEANPSSEDMADTIYKLQKRVDEYSTEANVYQEGDNRINVEIPGVTNADEILAELGTPGSLYFIAQTDADGNQNYTIDSTTGSYALNKTIEELEAEGSIVCSGSDVASAEGGVRTSETNTSEYVVSLTFSSEGAEKFAAATEKAYNSGESIGIYYDGAFVSVPRVNAVISDGKAEITGMESVEKAKELASYIRIGGLKLTLNEIRSNVVGAQLGQTAIRTSIIGGAIGLGIVCLIMIAIYLVPGVIAAFVLVLYAAIMLVLLNAFDLTLTLPGIAGIILSIGMAVDANVIIYARIREEINAGTSVLGAIRSGFHKAMSAILDGNITTLIAAAVLGYLGSGTIKGFAMTLALGVVLSMVTACVISRFIVYAVYAVGVRDPKFWARKKNEPKFDFISKQKLFAAIAALVIVIGFGAMGINAARGNRALNFSLEFLGGTSTTLELQEDYSLERLDNEVKPVVMEVTGDANVSLQKVVGSNQVIIKTRTLNVDERLALTEAMEENFNVDSTSITTDNISATVGSEMRKAAIIAVLVAVVLMLLYMFIRVMEIRFASAAVIALVHDVLITLAAYAVLRVSVGNSFIAVMLTILGYSINSTIVIFDRIREKMNTMQSETELRDIVNTSINQTLTRSIYTNLTTLASILVLYIVGVASIKEFTLPMMVGIVAGAYSSVFITGALWFAMRTKLGNTGAAYREAMAKAQKKGEKKTADLKVPESGAEKASNTDIVRKKKKRKRRQ